MCGTAEFLAPEIINFEDISFLTDMWAVGVICYILMSGYSPFLGDTDGDTYNNIARSGTENTFGYFYLQNTDLRFNFRCSILKKCERCDDYCAKKDGKQDRRAYTDRRGCGDPIDIDNLRAKKEGKKFKCEQDCSGWPYSSCKVTRHSNITQPAQSTS